MKEEKGDIWQKYYSDKRCLIVIPINLVVNRDGNAVMGKGLALQAKERFPALPRILGTRIEKNPNNLFMDYHHRMIFFPTKYHWMENSSIKLIERGVKELSNLRLDESVYLPHLGCGNGGLDWSRQVKPILEAWLDDNFIAISL